MSVYDENRRTCNRCGKLINHWTDNLCDKNMCKLPNLETIPNDVKRGWYDVGEVAIQEPGETVHLESVIPFRKSKTEDATTRSDLVRSLHDSATEIISDAIGEWIKQKNDLKLFDQINYAKALRIASNHLDDVSGS